METPKITSKPLFGCRSIKCMLPYIIIIIAFIILVAILCFSSHSLTLSVLHHQHQKNISQNLLLNELRASYMETISDDVFDAFYRYTQSQQYLDKGKVDVDKIKLRVLLGIFTQILNKYPDWAITSVPENSHISREFYDLANEMVNITCC